MLSNVYMIYTHKYIYIHYKVHVIQRNFLERKTSHQQETLLTACFPLRSPASIAGSSVGVNALPGNSKNHRRWATTTTKCQSTSQLLPSKIMERHNKTHGNLFLVSFNVKNQPDHGSYWVWILKGSKVVHIEHYHLLFWFWHTWGASSMLTLMREDTTINHPCVPFVQLNCHEDWWYLNDVATTNNSSMYLYSF